ncbi:hypothetical protein FACS1894126_4930 [Alphaproteobacteria bacterium]|nr:hypothetical protein FACS1894126_4930 [Alphaproteobacteria bacterium]
MTNISDSEVKATTSGANSLKNNGFAPPLLAKMSATRAFLIQRQLLY